MSASASATVELRPPLIQASSRSAASDGCVRALDLGVALAALVFVALFLGLLVLIIWLSDGHAPFFRHSRIGRDGRAFGCLKLRTMVPDADAKLRALLSTDPAARREWEIDHKLKRDPRITPLGRFLRRSSIDELPQLVNVLLGDMSIVGPRPIVAAEAERYGPYFAYYCSVRPGITGLWQVSGRNDVSYRRRVACDVLYARRRSLWTNIKIIAATVPAIMTSRGSY